MIRIKDNTIDVSAFSPQLVLGKDILYAIFHEKYQKDLIITCGREGKHSKTSLHYSGNAMDVRNSIFTKDERKEIVKIFNSNVNDDYELYDEDTHFHLEYQPKYKGD